jgi:4-aminobutyrate aminotransferase-like enzyme/aminoglycoside phosphotransferase (APT) family kinase protein
MKEGFKQLSALLQKHYGLIGVKITPMEGYESSNFKISVAHKSYVLKKYPFDEITKNQLEGENKILSILKNSLNDDFPEIIPTMNMEVMVQENDYLFRLLTFIEGEFLANVVQSPTLVASLGTFLGRMDKTIHSTYHVGVYAKETQWDLRCFEKNLTYLNYIADPSRKSLVQYFALQFQEHVLPIAPELRRGIIHNDANDWNVLLQHNKVSGIIDFGDMCYTWLINEVAIALTYVMMEKEDPLEMAIPLITAYHKVFPLKEMELDLLYYLIAARLCTSVLNSAYTSSKKPNSAYITISEKPAWRLLHQWLTINPIKASDVFRGAAGFSERVKPKKSIQLKRRITALSSSLSLSYDDPIQMHGAAFQYMYDVEGNTYLDAYNNIMLAGHCHPHIVNAGQRTMARLNTNTRYLYDELLSYSEKLLKKFPSTLDKVFFVNSGSAASDLAIRLAKAYTQKDKVMVMEHGYHGNTRMGIAISAYKYNHPGGPGKHASIIETPIPKVFGSGYKDDGSAGSYFATGTQKLVKEHANEIAAFIAEPIIGCGGQVPLPKGYLNEVYPQIREQGGVCISDEVQVGFGRLGNSFWGFEMYDVIPDIVVIGKPMGNGHPVAAVVVTEDVAKSFENGLEFFSSFGGNPVSCAIGEAVLDVIDNETLQQRALETGTYLKQQLKNLAQHHPQIVDVRGHGLFLGVEIFDDRGQPDTKKAAYLKNGLRQRNILVSTDGPLNNVIKIKPPLYFNKANADTLVSNIQILLEKE